MGGWGEVFVSDAKNKTCRGTPPQFYVPMVEIPWIQMALTARF